MKNKNARMTIRLPKKQHERIVDFARSRAVSVSAAVVELAELGLDASAAGADTRAALDDRLRTELSSIRALIAESIFATDTCARLVLDITDCEDPAEAFSVARRWAKSESRKLKSQA